MIAPYNKSHNILLNGNLAIKTRSASSVVIDTTYKWLFDCWYAKQTGTGSPTMAVGTGDGRKSPNTIELTGDTGALYVSVGQRVSAEKAKLFGRVCTFQCFIENNTGATLTPTVQITELTVPNDFSTSGAEIHTELPSIVNTESKLCFGVLDLSDLANYKNGFEIQIVFPPFALAADTKKVKVSELYFHQGQSIEDFELCGGSDPVERVLIGTPDDSQTGFGYNYRFLNLAGGSATSPALTFGGETGTGIFRKNTNSLGFAHNGTENANFSNSGNWTFNYNVVIQGDLTVNGTQFISNTETVLIEDNILTLNYGELGAGVTAGISGIEVERGSLTNYQFIFDEASDTFKIGQIGSLQKVATREDTPTTNGIPFWNGTSYRFDTDSRLVFSSDIFAVRTNSAMVLPSGTTTERNALTPEAGMLRLNTTENVLEYYISSWNNLASQSYSTSEAIKYAIVLG